MPTQGRTILSLGETMSRQDPVSKSDRALLLALAIILATVSAALGSAMTNHPNVAAPRIVAAPAAAPQDTVLAQVIAEHRCLSEALYYEARGEGIKGQQAVAEVVFRRMNVGTYGHSICAVVHEGENRPGCQFSFTCNGALHRPRDASAWLKSEQLAAQILTGAVTLHNTTGDATYYHAISVMPYWAPKLRKTAQIGNHVFYRDGAARVRKS